MNETNKLINEKTESYSPYFKYYYIKEDVIIFGYPIKRMFYYRVKLGFFLLIIVHLIFKAIDNFQFEWENKNMCMEKDPIWMFDERLEVERDIICKSINATHFCYKNTLDNYQSDKGVICKMKNFTLDPSKSLNSNITYKGPIDRIKKGSAILSKGFFSMKCDAKKRFKKYSSLYHYLFIVFFLRQFEIKLIFSIYII